MSLEQIQAFLESSEEVEFKAGNKEDLYEWVNQTLRQLKYRTLKRSGRGLVRRYVAKMTGLSRAQATRLLGMYLRGEKVQPKQYRRRRFPQRYTREDAALLASVDEAHNPKVEGSNPSPATNLFNRLRASGKINLRPTHINPHISFATARFWPLSAFDNRPGMYDNFSRKN